MNRTTLPLETIARLTAVLEPLDAALAARHPGASADGGRQPVHTCYLPADQMRADVVPAWGAQAAQLLRRHAPDPAALAVATGGDPTDTVAAAVHAHVSRTLATEPVQDLRVDLEDGYGLRADDVEDADAVRAAQALRAAAVAGTLPTRYGLRPKSLDPAVRARGLRSLDLFLTTLVGDDGPPPGLVLTVPKVSAPEQVRVFVDVLAALAARLGLPVPIGIEIQVETPAAVLALPDLVRAGLDLGRDPNPEAGHHLGRERGRAQGVVPATGPAGRLIGLHVGTYDYSAALGISGADQAGDHPSVEYATTMMQLVTAGTGIDVADGSSNLLPVDERPGTGGADVRRAWRRHADLVRRAWHRGLYQGWDLHPGQLVSRHAAVAGCLLAGLDDALARLGAYVSARDASAGAGPVADEPATGRALAGQILRALDAGLVDDAGLGSVGLRRTQVHSLVRQPTHRPDSPAR
ncbi:aldolase/citrate lyase family protein [Frankia sp. R82]|uniref:DUF6986 family protein n=1 Tax=Frankia sp. R82 TaxID=2950553 RepID=UPI002043479D|nr:aldolase/citrate lyase family protein [Frankia sp. R82]MCM3884437.1 aldolase/citrate lyase family protein [Frankia sp. R82]